MEGQPDINMPRYYRLDDEGNVHPVELMDWARSFESSNRWQLKTRVGHMMVSTVFLGLDHNWGRGPPVLFETMVFGQLDGDGDMFRYCTRQEAIEGHNKVVEEIKKEQSE